MFLDLSEENKSNADTKLESMYKQSISLSLDLVHSFYESH